MHIIPKREVSEQDLLALSNFLDTDHKDAKPLNLTKVHGFLCAIASAPTLIMPSKYQPVLLGGYPEFESEEQAITIIDILTSLNNNIIEKLRNRKKFQPLIWSEDKVIDYKKATFGLVGEWCAGYLEAVKLDSIWLKDKKAITALFPFGVLSGQHNLIGDLDNDDNVIEDDTQHKKNFVKNLPIYIRGLYNYWQEYRNDPLIGYEEPSQTVVRAEPKVGRNDPCSCGSGKKFKKCCGNSARTIH